MVSRREKKIETEFYSRAGNAFGETKRKPFLNHSSNLDKSRIV
jgi:hypothetical protein